MNLEVEFILILFLLLFIVLAIGTIGFKSYSNLSWIDAFHNSTLYLAGLGPYHPVKSNQEKLFSSFFAILSSIFVLTIIIYVINKIIKLEIKF
jgi:hypothetical protein